MRSALPERLRAAASAERLSDWVRVDSVGIVSFIKGNEWLFFTDRWGLNECSYRLAGGNDSERFPTRDAAIRAGLASEGWKLPT